MTYTIRLATLDDVAALTVLIADSARALGSTDYTAAQIEAALGTAWGVDTLLIHDGTYYVVEDAGALVGCGGWSMRRTLFGADGACERQPELLDPAHDAAKIRAFFIHPDYARRGIGRLLLAHCEAMATDHGFQSFELVATLPGRMLYETCGYVAGEPMLYPLGPDLTIPFVPMSKRP